MDSRRKNSETYNSPEGWLKCSDFWGDVCLGWFVLFSPQIGLGSHSVVQKNRCRLPRVQEGAWTSQYTSTAASDGGSSGRERKRILLVTSVESAFQSTLFRQPKTTARQVNTLSDTGDVPILALLSCHVKHHSSRSERKNLAPQTQSSQTWFSSAHTTHFFL